MSERYKDAFKSGVVRSVPRRLMSRRIAKKRKAKPVLSTLCEYSAITGVSILSILTEPVEAANSALTPEGFEVSLEARLKPCRSIDQRLDVFRALKAALGLPHPKRRSRPPSKRGLCKALNVSPGYAEYWFGDLASDVATKRLLHIAEEREELVRQVTTCVCNEGLPKYVSGDWRSIDIVVDNLAAKYHVPKRLLRAEMKKQLQEHRSTNPRSGVGMQDPSKRS